MNKDELDLRRIARLYRRLGRYAISTLRAAAAASLGHQLPSRYLVRLQLERLLKRLGRTKR